MMKNWTAGEERLPWWNDELLRCAGKKATKGGKGQKDKGRGRHWESRMAKFQNPRTLEGSGHAPRKKNKTCKTKGT